ncbi:hypothetical protein C2G38_2137591 [Gigaspora rosea]|uniref:Uncharacterized protein n=1 Tax=Gigaspora rosea TaxID=44941 RepID=A0A397W3Q8_9GLOM|nr:hypothetical protein C2G38_2137591 [Gigaspora rosea]
MTETLAYRPNVCPICLVCLVCAKSYSKECACPYAEIYWNKRRDGYQLDFCKNPLTQAAATIKKIKFDKEFVRWFHSNYASNFEVPPNLNYINICRECNKKYKKKENLNLQKPLIETELEETIDLTIDVTSNIQEYKEIKTLPKKKVIKYISLVCFNQFEQPRKKLDGAIPIPIDLNMLTSFEELEKEIFSCEFPKSWKELELDLICYQLSSAPKSDHFNLKTNDAIQAFIEEAKKRKTVQLCIYQKKISKKNKLTYGGSVVNDNELQLSKKIRGCLISDEGQHLKLTGEMITIWARAIITKIDCVDEKNLLQIPAFNKSNYRFPNSNQSDKNYKDPEITENFIKENEYQKLKTIMIHTKKLSPFMSNIHVTDNMTFE